MPLTLRVTRSTTLERASVSEVALSTDESSRFNLLRHLKGLHPVDDIDGSVRLHDPRTRSPLCLLREHHRGGQWVGLTLEVSLTAPSHMKCALDAFDIALEVATVLGAHAIEPISGQIVTKQNIDGLLAKDGRIVRTLYDAWCARQERLSSEGRAFLELPCEDQDDVPEYFSFSLAAKGQAPRLDELVRDISPHLEVKVLQVSALLLEPRTLIPLVRVHRRDREVVVSPGWIRRSFETLASETMAAVAALEKRLGVPAMFCQTNLNAELAAELSFRARGLGVDFYRWVSRQGPGPWAATGDARRRITGVNAARMAEVDAQLEELLARAPSSPTSFELELRQDIPFIEIQTAIESTFCRDWPWGPHWAPQEPTIATWRARRANIHYSCAGPGASRRIRGQGEGCAVVGSLLSAFMLTPSGNRFS